MCWQVPLSLTPLPAPARWGSRPLSRGSHHTTFIERDRDALAVLRANITRLDRAANSRVIAGDALSIASWRGLPASLMFADAPYGSGDAF
jgi:16S rRNA (guanine966-N2)-methyltransferase